MLHNSSRISRISRIFLFVFFTFFYSSAFSLSADQTLLLRQPDLSKTHMAFVYAGDIWIAGRDGSNPRRLTSHPASEVSPKFSPDGKWIAFSANYDNNSDVYVISTDGGQPTRLTWHPSSDQVTGWSTDGKKIAFISRREIRTGRSGQVYHVALKGGYPEKMMQAMAAEGVWSPNGKRFAYRPYITADRGGSGWRLHRGGTPPIWIIDPKSQTLEKIPHERGTDRNPIWLKDTVYFLSDRDNKTLKLYGYDTKSKEISLLSKGNTWDINSANGYGEHILYEAGGHLYSLNVKTAKQSEIKVSINPDLPQLRPQWKDASRTLQNIGLSPTAKRALLTARGDVYTVPLKDGSTRNLTHSDAIREMDALWSPKGDKIAYISDQGGSHKLIITDQSGQKTSKTHGLNKDTAYYSLLLWAGDGARILYQDNHLNLYAFDVESGNSQKIATDNRRNGFSLSMSKDGRWLAYTRAEANYFSTIMLYDFDNDSHTALTDGMSNNGSPAFSPDGKYLYFTASTNAGPQMVGLDMSTQERPSRSGLYAIVLAKDGKSPLLPKSDDENSDEEKEEKDEKEDSDSEKSDNDKAKEEDKAVKIDLEGIENRIVALPVAERNYTGLKVADDGALFYMERKQPGISTEPPGSERRAIHSLIRFDFEKKKAKKFLNHVSGFDMSADGKMLIIEVAGRKIMTSKATDSVKADPLNLAHVKAYINPREEWQQIFDEVWRMERDYFYDPALHGINWKAIYKKYQPLVKHAGRREDLNELMVDMIAELQVGHNRTGGGDVHKEKPVNIGLLGADLRIEKSHYRLKKIFTGEKWNPFLKAPLAAPGIGAVEGDYILAVNGQKLTAKDNIFSYFQNSVGKQVTLTVNKSPDFKDSKDIVVEPVSSETELRSWNWIESNRKAVEKATDGKVGYVYLPNTAGAGFTYFNRMFFAQVDKQAIILDERRNSGGQAANYITDVLSRTYLSGWKDRDGMLFSTPGGGIYGPKVMLIDQDAGSGGDFLPYSFRAMGLGTLIGKRTWGGLIGISANPNLIDGGGLVVPFFRFFTPDGQWRVENEGVVPDIEMELDPLGVNAGRDSQLERGIAEILEQLKDYKPVKAKQAPPMPTELGK